MSVGIYKITNPKNKIYIGQSTNIENRWNDYKKLKCKGQIKLYNSLKKYGPQNHIFEIIEECTLEELDNKEYYYKKEIINKQGWNNVLFLMLIDGKGGNKNISTKIKMNISSTKIHKKIKAYTLSGEYVGEYNSPSEARQILLPNKKISTGDILSSCRRHKQKTCKGYIFQFSDDNKIDEILSSLQNNIKLKQKTVLQYDLEGNFLKEYKNSVQAEREVGAKSSDIRSCCNGKQKTAKGYKWKYGEALLDNIEKADIINIKKRTKEYNKIKEEYNKDKILKQNYKNIIYSFIKENYQNEIQTNYNKEIDIFIPEYNLGINIYNLKKITYENSKKLTKLYKKYLKENIKLIQIFSDEIINKLDIVKSRILNELKLTSTKIHGRKCIVKEITNNTIKNTFLNINHIQGECKSKIKLGLYYNDELVSIMTFRYPRVGIGKMKHEKDNTWELIRFCNKINTNVIGAASKLLKHFIKNYGPKHIFSFADNRWSSQLNNVYIKLGLKETNKSNCGYFYTKDFIKRLHRSNFTKTKLKQLGYDISKTEHEIMKNNGYYRIYDCGTTRYELNLS